MDDLSQTTNQLIEEASLILSDVSLTSKASSSKTQNPFFDDFGSTLELLSKDDELMEFVNTSIDCDIEEFMSRVKDERSIQNKQNLNRCFEALPRLLSSLNLVLSNQESVRDVRSSLEKYSDEMKAICERMRNLRSQSSHLYATIENRKIVRQELGELIDTLLIKPQLIDSVLTNKANESNFVENVHQLHHKQLAIAALIAQGASEVESDGLPIALKEVCGVLDKLEKVVVTKSQKYISYLIGSLRKPMTNVDIVHQSLLHAHFLYEYICIHDMTIGKSIMDDYIETSSKTNYSYLTAYEDKLFGPDRKSLVHILNKNREKQPNHSRLSILKNVEIDDSIIIPHSINSTTDSDITVESLYRSLQIAILDTCSREHYFVQDFAQYYLTRTSLDPQELFKQIFDRTIEYLVARLKTFFRSFDDLIGIALCVHITRDLMLNIAEDQRKFDLLRDFYKKCLYILFEAFESFGRKWFADEFTNIQFKSEGIPLTKTRRYAELYSVLAAMNEILEIAEITDFLIQMQQSIKRLFDHISTSLKSIKDKAAFMITNYDLSTSIFLEHLSNKSMYMLHDKMALEAWTCKYIDCIIDSYFGGLATMFNESVDECSNLRESDVEKVRRTIDSSWKQTMDRMAAEVMRTFSNFKLGQKIVQKTFKSLLGYYSRFLSETNEESRHDSKNENEEVVESEGHQTNLPSLHEFGNEIRKYKTVF